MLVPYVLEGAVSETDCGDPAFCVSVPESDPVP